jgi:multiple sugar transport system permease protein
MPSRAREVPVPVHTDRLGTVFADDAGQIAVQAPHGRPSSWTWLDNSLTITLAVVAVSVAVAAPAGYVLSRGRSRSVSAYSLLLFVVQSLPVITAVIPLFTGFLRIVVRNSPPGILSTAIFTFRVSWNDYLVAIVFLRSQERFTLPIGVQSFFQQNGTDWGSVMALAVVMMLPPIIVFTVLNRYFSVGGSLAGTLFGGKNSLFPQAPDE